MSFHLYALLRAQERAAEYHRMAVRLYQHGNTEGARWAQGQVKYWHAIAAEMNRREWL